MTATHSGVRASLVVGAVTILAVSVVAGGIATVAASETSPTYVEDDITSDTTWTPEDGPYFVSTDVTISSGATLRIEPGTTVNVAEEVRVTVEGSLDASGTSDEPVAITTAERAPSAGTWQTIEYAGGPGSTLRLQHAVVEYGTTAITATSDEGTIEVEDSTIRAHVRNGIALQNRDGAPRVDVADTRFANLGSAGIEAAVPATNPYVEAVERLSVVRSTFEDTGSHGIHVRAREIADATVADVAVSGVDSEGVLFVTEAADARPTTSTNHVVSDVRVRGVRVTDAGASGIAFQGGQLNDVDILDSDVADVAGPGIHVRDTVDADAVRFDGNTVTESASGIRVGLQQPSGSVQHVSLAFEDNHLARNDRSGIDASLSHVVVESLDVTNNSAVENGDDGIRLRTQRVENTAVADNVVRGNDDRGVDVAGRHVLGLQVTRNRVTANGNDGVRIDARETLSGLSVARNSLLDNDGFGANVEGDRAGNAANELRENTVAANVEGLRIAGPATTVLANNSVAFNTAARERLGGPSDERTATGVVVENATGEVTLEHNDIYGHLTGLRSASNGSIDAEDNYWGAESGPYHATLNPDGTGNSVETDRGMADPVPFASEPFGPRFERPTAALAANKTTVEAGEPVAFTAGQSSDDGRISTYSFTVAGDRTTDTESSTHVTSFAEPGTYEVSLAVEDDMGVRSLNDASVTVTVEAATETTTTATGTTTSSDGTTTSPTTTSTPGGPGDGESEERSIADSLGSGWGGLGALFYLLAFVLGAYGTVVSMRGQQPPFSGRVAHTLAAFGIVTWLVAGVLVDGNLLTVAGAGAVSWTGLTGVVLALAS